MRLRTAGLASVSPRAFSSACELGGTISSSAHQTPALATCAAIRAPMVPAPKTTTFSMDRFIMAVIRRMLRSRFRRCIQSSVGMPTRLCRLQKRQSRVNEKRRTSDLRLTLSYTADEPDKEKEGPELAAECGRARS